MPVSDQGVSRERYMLVPRTLVFATSGDKVLLIKGAPHKRLWANLYNGIGGHVETGEDVLGAARRELLEETGLASQDLRLCGVITIDTGENPGILLFVHKCQKPFGTLKHSPEGSLEWIAQDQVGLLPLVKDLTFLLPRVLSWQPGQALFYGHYWYDSEGKLIVTFSDSH